MKLALIHPIGDIGEVDVRLPTMRQFRQARNRRPSEHRAIMDLHCITGLPVAIVRALSIVDVHAIERAWMRQGGELSEGQEQP